MKKINECGMGLGMMDDGIDPVSRLKERIADRLEWLSERLDRAKNEKAKEVFKDLIDELSEKLEMLKKKKAEPELVATVIKTVEEVEYVLSDGIMGKAPEVFNITEGKFEAVNLITEEGNFVKEYFKKQHVPGETHKMLGVPKGEKIPISDILSLLKE
jgi:predicted DNA-binding protein